MNTDDSQTFQNYQIDDLYFCTRAKELAKNSQTDGLQICHVSAIAFIATKAVVRSGTLVHT